MAAVFVPPSRETSLNMSTRRPLANVPNATNSPHRVGLVPAKRPRSTTTQIDIPYGQPPPKKQVVEGNETENSTSLQPKITTLQGTDSKLFTRRTNNAQPSAFEKKLVAARDKERQPQSKTTKQEKPSTENISIKQWQRHYRKAFPHFVFYFDCVPIDVRSKCSRQVMALGAREEKFFSRLVTHVVTSRPIPPEIDRRAPTQPTQDAPQDSPGDVQTVNPAELEMHLHLAVCPKREQSQDVLHRAREMGMKIWAVEKLQRMIATINDADIANSNPSRNHAGGAQSKSRGKDDLSQVLQNELNGPSDRSHLSVLKDLVLFKGPFIYVHDMDEKTRPVMVREYPKVAKRQDGVWPQFRSAPLGKCPFIEDAPTKREAERQRPRQEKPDKEKKTFIKPTVPPFEKAVEVKQQPEQLPPKKETSPAEDDEPLAPPPVKHEDSPNISQEIPLSPKKSSESFVPPPLHRKGPFYHGREPAASGVQPSNITSAIRSQIVSSTAAAPGAKAGLSKEVHELKRKVLEKSNGGYAAAVAHAYRPLDAPTATSTEKNHTSRMSNSTHPDKLGHIEEETTQSESNDAKHRANARRSGEQRKKERRRDPKPGYCENCRDKFDDFDEHVMTRKHRKFAANGANWAELDSLLMQLARPQKEEYGYA
ncbi:Dfp1/Him1, central region-domain-containing protein [Aspergillus heterothallicus]